MGVYTKQGDQGLTRLANGMRVPKDNVLVSLYGTVDELNSSIGLGLSFISDDLHIAKDDKKRSITELIENLKKQQHLLFELGSELAVAAIYNTEKNAIHDKDIQELEQWMDSIEEQVGPMRYFILPGGSKSSASLHLSRTICRRVEREFFSLFDSQFDKDGIENIIQIPSGNHKNSDMIEFRIKQNNLKYINRLSDYLFMAARLCNWFVEKQDIAWEKRES